MNNNTNCSTCRIPAGYIAIPTEEYRENIEAIVKAETLIKIMEAATKAKDVLIEDLLKDNKEMSEKLDDFEKFFFHKHYAETMYNEYKEEQKAKDEAKKAEAPDGGKDS